MLLELEIKQFALVDHLVIEFGEGLTVLTGETGAGKSVILDSLTFLLGGSPRGADAKSACRVAGRFAPTPEVNEYLDGQGLPSDPGELLVLRERKEGGRTTSRLNGSIVSVSQLGDLSQMLVDLHGQHQSYALTRPGTHLPMLDRLGGDKQARELVTYSRLYQEYQAVRAEMAEIRKAERERLREVEWLKLELEEIDKIKPRSGELEELEGDIRRRAASEDLARGTGVAMERLGHDGAVLDGLAQALSALGPLERFDSSLGPLVERMKSADIELQEVFRELSDYVEGIEHDPAALDQLQQRAEALKSLCRKYGPTMDDVLEHRRQTFEKIDRLENSEVHLRNLSEKEQALLESLDKSASRLTRGRRKAAADLGTELVAELAQLAMPKVAFQVEFQTQDEFGPEGKEKAQFLFSPNPGRSPTALSDTASGGELSRVMLALVSILSRFQERPTLVLDEIDAGLGGRTAEAVAAKLARLGKKVQVICVTHLPVVAAAATGHLVVEKESRSNATVVSVTPLNQEQRVSEVARMLSGDASKERARELACELLYRKV